jgi:hydroxyacylglutathione hydrolase
MLIRQIFDPALAQYAYLVGCQRTGEAVIIDPERDIERYQAEAAANGLRITAVAETHIHADFVSGAAEFATDPHVHLYLSAEGGPGWLYEWPGDRAKVTYLKDGDAFKVGNIRLQAVHTPGHTPEHISFLITDEGGGAEDPMALATGDFLFVGDVGRPDLLESAAGVQGVMESSARTLQVSLEEKLKSLGDYLLILPAHGAGSACGKALGAVPVSSLGYERRTNGALREAISDAGGFVAHILAGQPEPQLYFANMKKVNKSGIRVTGGVPALKRLTADEALAAQKQGNTPLDVRTDKAAFAAGHLAGSLSAPLGTPFFSTSTGSYIAPDQPTFLVVDSAEQVADAAAQLYRIGLDGCTGWVLLEDLKAAGYLNAKIKRIEFADFKAKEIPEGVLIDVRTSAEFQRGHIEGARHFPYTRLKTRVQDLEKSSSLYLHCGSGRRAGLAASYLAGLGYDVVHVDGICSECERIARLEGEAF